MKEYKPRDKITQKMTRDGAVEVNETKQTAERISKREQETDLQKTPGAADNPHSRSRPFPVCPVYGFQSRHRHSRAHYGTP